MNWNKDFQFWRRTFISIVLHPPWRKFLDPRLLFTREGKIDGTLIKNWWFTGFPSCHHRIPSRVILGWHYQDENDELTLSLLNADSAKAELLKLLLFLINKDNYPWIDLTTPVQMNFIIFPFQMVWEQGSVVIVMLTKLTENGEAMCHRYWPEEGSDLYHIYEVTS